ncbi:MAG TPA: cyclopropane-fatty-acyl-phospholipid synthase family protein [Oligoflexus sp.]|uniref:SAM-dependent methyltransferase n=1 Tax=Oligoflexus sp. TaxID=1971216 RepID=UPI002D36A957|nr:cyclopropane-fatty-acyl-phospholipid synthase family protein [Oligoflexus sp.]HYX32391.1 cyclopropane-fatty-acyl-phospholipid synthase family protein [Oligoflexus sp.]
MEALLRRGLIPEPVIRLSIQQLLRKRIADESKHDVAMSQEHLNQLIKQLKDSPIAIETAEANRQHYELPPEFFQMVMGRWLKYSCGLWDSSTKDLSQSEENMLQVYLQRAGIQDGMEILELGCGWGSFSLFTAKRFPGCKVTGVSNSGPQRQFIMKRAAELGIKNLEIITQDVNKLEMTRTFDRVVSIEMFEHMRNYEKLLGRISGWLKPEGKLFVHIFTHKNLAYLFEDNDASDWLTRNFFTGGIMPSDHLLFYFNRDLRVDQHWVVNGQNYQKTSEAWLANMKAHEKEIMAIFQTHYKDEAQKWWNFWKIFFLACAELWGFRQGNEWHVSHYLFSKVK